MAKEKQDNVETDKTSPAPGKGGLFVWLIMGVVILACATGGFALSQLMGSSVPAADPNAHTEPAPAEKFNPYHGAPTAQKAESSGHGAKKASSGHGAKKASSGHGAKKADAGNSVSQTLEGSWIYEKMDPIVANLDEPGVSRFVRVTVILEMNKNIDIDGGMAFLDEKKIVLQDWMTTYLAGLSLEDVRGSRNLTRIKQEVLEHFNQILFDQGKPYIDRVLFKEFAVQ